MFTSIVLAAASLCFASERVFTLQDAYQAALGSHEIIKIAEESVVQSDFRIDQAQTYLYPRIVGQGAYTRYNETLPSGGGPVVFQPEDQFHLGIILTQPLYTGGRTMAAYRTAQKMRESSASSLSTAKQDMMLQVAEIYYSVLKAQRSVDISKRSLERMERHQKVIEQEAATRKTKANHSALLRAQSLVAQARIALLRSQDGLRIAKEKLALLTRFPADMVLAEPELLSPNDARLEDLQKSALAVRDELAASRILKSIAEENVTIVEGGHYPQLAAEAGITYHDSRPATALDATVYYAGLRLQVPIFEGGLKKAEVSEARSRVRQAELSSDLLRKSIASEVHEQYVNLQTVSSVLETAQLQMKYAQGSFDTAEGLFLEGLLPSLSIIDAEQGLTFAERELTYAEYDRQLAILRLQKSLGTLGKILN